MLRIIPLLTDPASYGGDTAHSFDVVVPSLPGLVFPTGRKHGMNSWRIAEPRAGLMAELGYERFAAQGGDLARRSALSWDCAMLAGWSVPQLHPGSYRPHVEPDTKLDPIEQRSLDDTDRWYADSGAYAHLQRNTPRPRLMA